MNIIKTIKNLIEERELKFKKVEAWNLCNYTNQYILPRLRYFRSHLHGHPARLTQKEWENILDEMIAGFDAAELLIDDDWWYDNDKYDFTKEMTHIVRTVEEDGSTRKVYSAELSEEGEARKQRLYAKIEELEIIRKKGMNLFIEYYLDLWD